MALIEVDEMDYQNILEDEFAKGNTVILKFVTEMCDACMALGFELEDIEERDDVSVLEIDCVESEELASEYGVYEVPTMIIYKDPKTVLYNSTGVIMAQDIEKIIDEKE